jgi:phage major head subunit gpT-like protein
MQINQSSLTELFRAYRVIFNEAYQAGAAMWDQVATLVPSSAAEEVYAWLGSFPGMKKLLGEITVANLAAHRYSIVNDEYYDAIGVRQADIERNAYGLYNPRFSALGLAAKQHPDELIANLLLAGFTTKCYTGKNFFDTGHEPQKGKTTFDNKGTKKLSSTNFETARADIKSRKNAEGRPLNLGLRLLLVVSAKNEALGRQILQADFIQQIAMNKAGTENVASAAVTNVNKGTASLMVWPQLGGSDAWFLLETGWPMKPLIHQQEVAPVLTALDTPTSDHVFKNHEFLYQAYGRYAAGYGLPELAWGSTGADAA